ncbi:hypothetical protein VKI21_02205 [Cyanobacterium aponinum UTEX 3222]|uniref:hypothetical protein n=1 Tax=Cyanobacterium aponinum TaxID=379064 RepID=UPI00308BC8BB|nr:hypothetical protein VKI21_02205 [Cyanobacterium aponinum UTEX 3222]
MQNINLQKINNSNRFYLYLTQNENVFTGTIFAKSYNQQLGKFTSIAIDGVTYFNIKTLTNPNIFELTKKVQNFVKNFEEIEVQADKYNENNIKRQIDKLTQEPTYKIVAKTLQYNIKFSNKAIERLAKVAYYSGYELVIRETEETKNKKQAQNYNF